MIQSTRIQKLNEVARRIKGDFILYWMQEAQRCQDNQALELAIRSANKYGVTVVVCFGIMDSYPEANERHYAFMLEGLADVAQGLRSKRDCFHRAARNARRYRLGTIAKRHGGNLREKLHAEPGSMAPPARRKSKLPSDTSGD